jgi:transglutaminase-like putative cysteine protease
MPIVGKVAILFVVKPNRTNANLTTAAVCAVALLSLLACHSLSDERLYHDAGTDADSDADTDADGNTGGALLRGIHHSVLDYLEGDEPGIVWLPLPMDHATQVPLYVELVPDPATEAIVSSVEYQVDELGNFGALVELTQDGALEGAVLHWDAIAFTRDVDSQERPVYYAATSDPTLWTEPTALADSSHEGIAATAASATATAITELDEMQAIISWTSTNIEYPTDWTDIDSLDATSAFELGQSSSTGFANLATALGRAAGLPTRTVADLYVGLSQQTHYLNQFYLGEDLGWRRVEPQADVELLPEEYALTLRVVSPADEDELALGSDLWAFPGTPLYCQVQPVQGSERMLLSPTPEYFDDCAACDNRAELAAELTAPASQMTLVFDTARELWQRDLLDYLDGGLDESIMEARRAALDAEDIADVIAILSAIN